MSFLQKAKEAMQQPVFNMSSTSIGGKSEPSLERELRKAQSIIKQSADAAAISKMNDEVKKLKNELEIMSDYKNQIHLLLQDSSKSADKHHKSGAGSPVDSPPKLSPASISNDEEIAKLMLEKESWIKRLSDAEQATRQAEKKASESAEMVTKLETQILDLNQKLASVSSSKDKDVLQILEAKDKDTKRLIEDKEKEITAKLEAKYKAEKDAQKATQKHLEDKEKELKTTKQQHKEIQDQLSKKIADLQKSLQTTQDKCEALEQSGRDAEEKDKKIASQLQALTDQLNSASSRCDLLQAELDVARAAQERASLTLQEREDAFKKLVQRFDELFGLNEDEKERSAKKDEEIAKLKDHITQIEKESSETSHELAAVKADLDKLQTEKNNADEQIKAAQQAKEELEKKVAETEREMKALERKNMMLVKDYQKHLAKQQHEKQQQPDVNLKDEAAVRTIMSSSQAIATENSKLKDQLNVLQAAKTKMEAEIKELSEKLTKTTKEAQAKSKMVIQYALRDNLAKLQPVLSNIKQDGNKMLSMLSNVTTLKQLDSHTLVEINQQLQSVLGDVSARNFELEEEVTALKDLVRKSAGK